MSGVSNATLNMDIGSSMTGSVAGPSTLFYYGTNITVNVTTDALSAIEASAIVTGGAFARRVLDAVTENKAIMVIPSWWKLFWYVNRLFPLAGIGSAEEIVPRSAEE